MRDREPGGDVAVGGDDDFVARADAARQEDELQGFEPVGDADAMRRADGGRVFGFKGFELAPQQKPAGVGDAPMSGVELGAEFGRGGCKI